MIKSTKCVGVCVHLVMHMALCVCVYVCVETNLTYMYHFLQIHMVGIQIPSCA